MKRASAPSYDLLKTIVPVILVLILILMLLSGCATNAAAPARTETIAAPNATETIVPSPVPPTVESTSTPTTAAPSPKSTSAATKQAKADAPTPTAASAAKEQPPTPLPDAASPAPDQNASCNTSLPSRLSVGQTARVVQRLNMRSEASITAAILRTNPIGTQVEIIGGPVCTPVGRVAYRWWQIRLADGAEGWSTESQIKQANYFLEPVQ